MPDKFYSDETFLTSYKTLLFSFIVATSAKLIIFNIMNTSSNFYWDRPYCLLPSYAVVRCPSRWVCTPHSALRQVGQCSGNKIVLCLGLSRCCSPQALRRRTRHTQRLDDRSILGSRRVTKSKRATGTRTDRGTGRQPINENKEHVGPNIMSTPLFFPRPVIHLSCVLNTPSVQK